MILIKEGNEMALSFQEKLKKILREDTSEGKTVLNEDQKDSPTRVHPEAGQDVTHGVIDGTGKIDANGPIPTGLDKTLKTNPGPTTSGPTGHIPTNSDIPNGGKPSYGLGEEAEDKDEDKKVEEGKVPPFLKKDKKEGDDDEKKDEKIDEENKVDAKGGEEDNNRAGFTKKSGGDGEKFNEETDPNENEVTEEKCDDDDDKKAVEEATEKLFDGEQLSEAFKTKAATIFEDALSARIKDYRAKVKTRLTVKLNERVEEIREELANKVNGHLDLVVENWVKTNEVALESAIKTQLVEDFIGGLKALYEEHYFEVPKEKMDVVAEMATKITDLEGKLNEQIETNVQLQNKVRLSERNEIFTSVTKGLVNTQVEKVKGLVESVQDTCKTNEEYKTLVERYVEQERNSKNPTTKTKSLAEQTLEQNVPNDNSNMNQKMSAVKDVLARMAKK
jgi:hypothetical protein